MFLRKNKSKQPIHDQKGTIKSIRKFSLPNIPMIEEMLTGKKKEMSFEYQKKWLHSLTNANRKELSRLDAYMRCGAVLGQSAGLSSCSS